MNPKSIFSLIYRLLALASLAWGLYHLAFVPFNIIELIQDDKLAYTLPNAFVTCLPDLILHGAYLFYGLFALHFAPLVLGWLYREE